MKRIYVYVSEIILYNMELPISAHASWNNYKMNPMEISPKAFWVFHPCVFIYMHSAEYGAYVYLYLC